MNVTEVKAGKIVNKPYKYEEFPKLVFRGGESRMVNNPDDEQHALDEGWSETSSPSVSVIERKNETLSTLPGAIVAHDSVKRELEEKVAAFNKSWAAITQEKDLLKKENDSLAKIIDEQAIEINELRATIAELKPKAKAEPKKVEDKKPPEPPANPSA